MSIYGLFAGKGKSGFGYNSTAEEVTEGLSLKGKTILITGCNSGLGFEAMRVLAMRGAKVVGTARTVEKAKEAGDKVGGDTVPVACELSEPKSVWACVDEVKKQGLKLDAIIANAGIMALPNLETVHGYEKQFFTNHIGHFILVTGLLDQLTEQGRVVMLSSDAHLQAPKGAIEFDNLDGSKRYAGWRNYGQSKIANILFAVELAKRLQGTKKTANALHPGVINTNLSRNMNAVVGVVLSAVSAIGLKSIPQGAATEVFVATHPSLDGVSGEYFADSNVTNPRADAKDPEIARKLWEVSEKIVSELPRA